MITTIMLNYIAVWVATYLINGGPLQDPNGGAAPISKPIDAGAQLPVIWDQDLNGGIHLPQGLHMGVFVALGALVLYWAVINRTTLGYAVRAVGFNPEAARYGGISVSRNYFLAMAISGAFAGLAGSMDILGWQFRLDTTSTASTGYSQIAFIGIAVALLGRNTAVGVFLAAMLFAALKTGTSTRNLDPNVFRPDLANNLTQLIQGLIVLFVGADVLILYLWTSGGARSCGSPRQRKGEPDLSEHHAEVAPGALFEAPSGSPGSGSSWAFSRSGSCCRRSSLRSIRRPRLLVGGARSGVRRTGRSSDGARQGRLGSPRRQRGAWDRHDRRRSSIRANADNLSAARHVVDARLAGDASSSRRRCSSPPSAGCSPSAAAW